MPSGECTAWWWQCVGGRWKGGSERSGMAPAVLPGGGKSGSSEGFQAWLMRAGC